jgi:hypothetical protein
LYPGKVVLEARQRHLPIAAERVETKRVFIDIGAFDGIVVVKAVDPGAWTVAGDDDRRVFWRLVRDDARGHA